MANNDQKVIKFYHIGGELGCFSNFSHHPVRMENDLEWPTSEHYFQAMKFPDYPEYMEHIRKLSKPGDAKRAGRTRKYKLRSDWERVKDSIMMDVCLAKFRQHDQCRKVLLSTGDALLVENAPNDSYWGCGKDGKGRNQLGKTLMAVVVMTDSSQPLFAKTARWQASIKLLNGVDIKRMPALLIRVAKNFYRHNEIFSTAEQGQLQKVLNLSEDQLSVVIDACSYIFEQAAYVQATPTALKGHLEACQMAPTHIKGFLTVWQQQRSTVLQALRCKSVVPKQVSAINWQLHLQLAQSSLSKVKTPSAVFEFQLTNSDAQQTTDSTDGGDEKLHIEFSHAQLFEFYQKLEQIQQQLDALS